MKIIQRNNEMESRKHTAMKYKHEKDENGRDL